MIRVTRPESVVVHEDGSCIVFDADGEQVSEFTGEQYAFAREAIEHAAEQGLVVFRDDQDE